MLMMKANEKSQTKPAEKCLTFYKDAMEHPKTGARVDRGCSRSIGGCHILVRLVSAILNGAIKTSWVGSCRQDQINERQVLLSRAVLVPCFIGANSSSFTINVCISNPVVCTRGMLHMAEKPHVYMPYNNREI